MLIGGGIIGASIAYHLRQDGFSGRLLVIERDTTYARAATPLSLGGIRQLYGVACNIQMACYRALSNVRASCTAPGSRMKS